MKKTVLVDDLDGKEAAETITFGLDGDQYEIDLSRGNAKELRDTFARYAKVARPLRRRNGVPKKRTPASSSKAASPSPVKPKAGSVPSPIEVREWAKDKGVPVSQTGRIPKSVIEQYLADKPARSTRKEVSR